MRPTPILLKRDILASLNNMDVWWYFAKQDIRLRYRRSIIGPFWTTLSTAIFCVCLGLVYSKLFKANVAEYMPFIGIGFIFWTTLSSMINEFPEMLIIKGAYLRDIKTNFFDLLFRFLSVHMIVFLHNAVIIFALYLVFHINPGFVALMVIPGLMLVLVNLLMIGVLLSIIGLRYRDIKQIVQSFTQVLFFITPIMWFPRLLGENNMLVFLNPFYSYIDLLRTPLLGDMPALTSWLYSLFSLLVLGVLATLLYQKKVQRLPYWL